jgi:hypothetical protein
MNRPRNYLVIALAALLLAAPVTASATTGLLDGSHLDVYTNENGQLQARLDAQPGGEFFSPSATPANAGLNLAVQDQSGAFALHGFLGNSFVEVSAPVVSGDGSSGNPFRMSNVYRTQGSELQITQVIGYVNGPSEFTLSYGISNPSNQGPQTPVRFRASLAADLYVAGNDAGRGYFNGAGQRRVGGVNSDAGSLGLIVDLAPPGSGLGWTQHEANAYGTVFSKVTDPAGPGFDGTVVQDSVDNGVGVQWDQHGVSGLLEGQTTTFTVGWRFIRFQGLGLTPESGTDVPGERHVIRAVVDSPEGGGAVGEVIRYTVFGANPQSGQAVTGAGGSALIAYTGKNEGTDTVSVYVDLNRNGEQDPDEASRQATVEWVRPEAGRTAVLRPVSGAVLVSRSSIKGGNRAQTGQASGFVPLTDPAVVGIGALVDATHGVLEAITARNRSGNPQDGQFSGGQFKIRQKRASKPVTDVLLTERLRCRGSSGPRKRTLTAEASGRFRVVGRFANGTPRGKARWITTDRCTSTTIKVRKGKVTVRDVRRHRTVTLKKGRSYRARR